MSAAAAVLVGGRSSRMGLDKATIRLGTETMLERICRVLEQVVPRVLLIGGNGVPDLYPNEGPLGGIITALTTARADLCFVAPCDHPLLCEALVRRLLTIAEKSGCDAVMPRLSSGIEPLHAVYARSCLEPTRRAFESGLRAPHALGDHLQVCYVEEDELRRFDPHLRSFFNVNTPADAAAAQQMVG